MIQANVLAHRNEEKILMEALRRIKRDEQLEESRNRHRNRSKHRMGITQNRHIHGYFKKGTPCYLKNH